MKSKVYLIIDKQNKEVRVYHEVTLFGECVNKGLVSWSDIKAVGEIDFLINKLSESGVLIFSSENFIKPVEKFIKVGSTSSELTFENLSLAIAYCKDKGLSTAGEPYIRSTLLKNLEGRSKSAYGKSWSYVESPLDLTDYSYRIVL